LNFRAERADPKTYNFPAVKELQLNALVRNIPVVLFSLDKDLKLKWANPAFQNILGYPPDEVASLKNQLLNIVIPQDRSKCLSWLKGITTSTEPLNEKRRFRIISKDGSILYCSFKPYLISIQDQAPYRKLFHFMIIDETDRVLLERCALRDQRLKNLGAIAAEVAHEIKNTIISIGGFAKRLRKAMPSSTEVRIIEEESDRLERLVKSINTYVRPGQTINRTMPVGRILKQSLELMAPEFKSHGVRLKLMLDSMADDFVCDRDALSEVFVNLIKNAIEALDPGGCLMISSFSEKGHLYIDFENQMKKKSIVDPSRLFRSIEEGGTSIGLPLSFRIMKNLGGNLSFTQRGNHAVFRVELPAIQPQ